MCPGKAIDYSLNRWEALTRFLVEPALPIDNHHDEQQTRPLGNGPKELSACRPQIAGQRVTAITSRFRAPNSTGLTPATTCATCWQDGPGTRPTDLRNDCLTSGLVYARLNSREKLAWT